MDAQLMGSPRERLQYYSCEAVCTLKNMVTGHGTLAMFIVHPLTRPVLKIRQQWEVDNALILQYLTFKQRDIALFDRVLFKLLLQGFVGYLILGENDQS